MSKVFVGLLNWNRCEDLRRLINSVLVDLSDQSQDYKIFVIDNASTDNSVEMIKSEFPDINLIINKNNLGGSGGFNTILQHAITKNYDFVWLLDNDAEVLPGAFQGLIGAMESDTNIALVGSKILHRDDPNVICELGANINPLSSFPRPKYQNIPDSQLIKTIIDVDYVAICSALVRVDSLKNVGILDERFFLMWDDMEWGMRIRRHGYRVVATSASKVIHPGFSERVLSPLFIYYAWRNHLYFVAVTYSGLRRLVTLCYISGLLHAAKLNSQRLSMFAFKKAYDAASADFFNFQFGKIDRSLDVTSSKSSANNFFFINEIKSLINCNDNVFLLSADRPVGVVKTALGFLKEQFPNTRFVILVNYSRQHLFSWHDQNDLWVRKGVFEDLFLYRRLIKSKIDSILIFEGVSAKVLLSSPSNRIIISDSGYILKIYKSGVCFGLMEFTRYLFNMFYGLINGSFRVLFEITKRRNFFRDLIKSRKLT